MPRDRIPGDRNIVGFRIKARRLELGLTQKETVRLLSEEGQYMSVPTLSKIENQKRSAYDTELVAIAAVLRIPVGNLFPSTFGTLSNGT